LICVVFFLIFSIIIGVAFGRTVHTQPSQNVYAKNLAHQRALAAAATVQRQKSLENINASLVCFISIFLENHSKKLRV
jgi:hypothetical protein